MNACLLRAAFAAALVSTWCVAEEDAPKTGMKEALKARIAEDAKKAGPKKPAAAAPSTAAATPSAAAPATPPTPSPPAKSDAPAAKAPAPAATPPEKPTVLPKVEVTKGRITVLDQQLAQQDELIAREKKNLQTSEVDLALNDVSIAKPLAIFGGDSAQFRKRVASERVEMMEAEKDVLEAIAHARTKEEKQELQNQLDQLRTLRRELDKALR